MALSLEKEGGVWWTVYYYDLYITINEFCMFFLIWLFL